MIASSPGATDTPTPPLAIETPLKRPRRGAALLVTLIVMIALALLSTGSILGSMQEYRAGRRVF